MPDESTHKNDHDYSVRPFAAGDSADVDRLARDGLLPGHVDHSPEGTLSDPHGSAAGHPTPESFLVVETEGRVIGTIAMIQGDPEVGHLLQLRIVPALQTDPNIARLLVRAATECALHRGILKLVIESPGLEIATKESGEHKDLPVIDYLRDLSFKYIRTRRSGDRMMLEFYLDLYQSQNQRI